MKITGGQRTILLIWASALAVIVILHNPTGGYAGVWGDPPLSRMPGGKQIWHSERSGCESLTLHEYVMANSKRYDLFKEALSSQPAQRDSIMKKIEKLNRLGELCFELQPTIYDEELQPFDNWKSIDAAVEFFRSARNTLFVLLGTSVVAALAFSLYRKSPAEA